MKKIISFILFSGFCTFQAISQGTIINHTCTDITNIPQSAIDSAKAKLHIAYGHTSHGSQLINGMNELISFANTHGLELDLPSNIFTFNNGGTDGALDLRDNPFSGANDLGNPNRTAWEQATRDYLGTPNAQGKGSLLPSINVIIWSWCGQVDGSEADIDNYLTLMNGLEQDYFGVKFVYMTGHLNGTGETGNVNVRNQQIRNYCTSNNKILYDFADIESYDPDGLVHYMPLLADDNCDYDSDGNGSRDANWATAWQNSHTQGVDWFNCSAAHSQPLNGNLKAYAAWWLWAILAGWEPPLSGITDVEKNSQAVTVFPNPSNGKFTVTTIDGSIDAIYIYNVTGIKVFSTSDIKLIANNEIDISDYKKGIYFIKIDSRDKIHTKKIVIQ
ncbi:MAG: T9SS type A sorting domain-containing protein [Bacteroidota bacterium]